MIKNSLDWAGVEASLLRKSSRLTNYKDLKKMILNVRRRVTDLSKAEVLTRQGKSYVAIELLDDINKDIANIEEYLLVASLMG